MWTGLNKARPRLQSPGASVTTAANRGKTPTLGLFAFASGTIPFDRAFSRISVQFTDRAAPCAAPQAWRLRRNSVDRDERRRTRLADLEGAFRRLGGVP